MTPEKNLHYTLIKYLDIKGFKELSSIIKQSKIVYEKKQGFTGIVSDQRHLTINIKTSLDFIEILEDKKDVLEKMCFEIYEDNEYRADELKISILASNVTTIEIEEIEKEIVQDSIYQTFMAEVLRLKLDIIEQKYLIEACECAMRNNRLAASAMLGCAAEYLLINLCLAYKEHLKNNFSEQEETNFEKKVINAKCAYDRLNEFEKRVESNIKLFKSFGMENPKLNFNFLDIIRKVRNQSGHPTGDYISANDLKMIFGNYQHFIKITHLIIKELSKYKEDKSNNVDK